MSALEEIVRYAAWTPAVAPQVPNEIILVMKILTASVVSEGDPA